MLNSSARLSEFFSGDIWEDIQEEIQEWKEDCARKILHGTDIPDGELRALQGMYVLIDWFLGLESTMVEKAKAVEEEKRLKKQGLIDEEEESDGR